MREERVSQTIISLRNQGGVLRDHNHVTSLFDSKITVKLEKEIDLFLQHFNRPVYKNKVKWVIVGWTYSADPSVHEYKKLQRVERGKVDLNG